MSVGVMKRRAPRDFFFLPFFFLQWRRNRQSAVVYEIHQKHHKESTKRRCLPAATRPSGPVSFGTIRNTKKESKQAKEQLANATRDIWRAFSFDLLFWG
jgi:hypothetical protein